MWCSYLHINPKQYICLKMNICIHNLCFLWGMFGSKKKDYGKTDDDQDWSSFMSVYSL